MALDLTPEQKKTGKENFQRVVGKLAEADSAAPAPPGGVTRRRFMQGLVAATAVAPVSAAAYFGYSNTAFRGRPVKAAIIGTGDEGGVLVGEHNPAYVEFVAYSDIRPSNQKRIFEDERTRNPSSPRRGFKYHYGNDAPRKVKLYDQWTDLLQDREIEMVVIALPLHLHAEVTEAALRAGKHVLCEKLMGWNIRQCKSMIRAADETGKLLSIGHQRHYSLLYAHANDVVESGVLGDIRHIRALWHRLNVRELPADQRTPDRMYLDSWRPAITAEDRNALANSIRRLGYKSMEELVRWRLYKRTGGGLMAELGSHQLDACSIFLGKKHPIAVSATGGKHFYRDDREVEDHVYCTYEYPGKNFDPNKDPRDNDTVIVTYSSISTNGFEPYGECLMGSKGTLVVETEQNAYLYGQAGRGTEVTASTTGGRPVLDASSSTAAPAERRAQATGETSLGLTAPSRGYREEMEHLAYLIRSRDEGMESDRQRLQPRCHGRAAMADAIVALTANKAMRDRTRIVFNPRWFDAPSDEVPDADQVAERISG